MNNMISRKGNTANLVKFNIQSLYNNEMFFDITSVVNEPWCDDVSTPPRMQQLSQFKHFGVVEILGLDNCDTVDVLIGNDNAHQSQTLFGNPKRLVEQGNPNTCAETKRCLILFYSRSRSSLL